MDIQEHVRIGSKTTMRIGGTARYYAEVSSRADVEQAVSFAQDQGLPLILLGGGANTIFVDSEVNALVIRLKAEKLQVDGNTVTVEAGMIIGSFINTLADKDLDFSALTGIPGTIGGAIFGNAGQGPKGIWINSFVKSVTAFVDGAWKEFSAEECNFRYRESVFKDMSNELWDMREKNAKFKTQNSELRTHISPIIWEVTLEVPSRPTAEIKAEVERLLQQRFQTQPHLKTAGSCFKALPDGTPAWKLIDAAGLRGLTIGGVQVSEKHANFLLNVNNGTFQDALQVVKKIKAEVPQIAGVEMRFIREDGSLAA